MIVVNGEPLVVEGKLNEGVIPVGNRRSKMKAAEKRMQHAVRLEIRVLNALPASGPGLPQREVAYKAGALPRDSAKKVPYTVTRALRRLEAQGLARRRAGTRVTGTWRVWMWTRTRRPSL
jgi:hypothetical protein